MRDFLATLLQVSFSARECGDDLNGCLEQWSPLLKAVAKKRGGSVSALICDALVRSLQIIEDFQLSSEEIESLPLCCENGTMGSSSIERWLDDCTLSHCFSFLTVKDICLGIERTCHRFSQVSRNRKQPFYEGYLEWRTDNGDGFDEQKEVQSAFDRLVYSKPLIPRCIALRSLGRFKVTNLSFDPELADKPEFSCHQLRFTDVINAIAKDVQSCFLSSMMNLDCRSVFPRQLSHIQDVEFYGASDKQFAQMCQVFSECHTIELSCTVFSNPGCLAPLNHLTRLQSLTLDRVEIETNGECCLDPSLLSNLNELTMDAAFLPVLSPILTPNIHTLNLEFSSRSINVGTQEDLKGIGMLTNLEYLRLEGLTDLELSRAIKNRLSLPQRIPMLTLRSDWNILQDWVDIVEHLEFYLHFKHITEPKSLHTLSLGMLSDDILRRWGDIKQCSIRVNNPDGWDIGMIRRIVDHAKNTRFKIILDHFIQSGINNDDDDSIPVLESLIKTREDGSTIVIH